MARVDADVWVLTETRLSLAPEPLYRLVAHSANAPDCQDDAVWTAIWVRDVEAQCLKTHHEERTACAKLQRDGAAPLLIYGTVLPWLADQRRVPLTGFAAFSATLVQQQADWQALQAAHPASVLCVAGDFNQDLLERGHYYGSSAGRHALRAALAAAKLARVCADGQDPVAHLWPGLAAIDHILLTNTAAYEAQAVYAWPSRHELGSRLTDHFGLAVTVS